MGGRGGGQQRGRSEWRGLDYAWAVGPQPQGAACDEAARGCWGEKKRGGGSTGGSVSERPLDGAWATAAGCAARGRLGAAARAAGSRLLLRQVASCWGSCNHARPGMNTAAAGTRPAAGALAAGRVLDHAPGVKRRKRARRRLQEQARADVLVQAQLLVAVGVKLLRGWVCIVCVLAKESVCGGGRNLLVQAQLPANGSTSMNGRAHISILFR